MIFCQDTERLLALYLFLYWLVFRVEVEETVPLVDCGCSFNGQKYLIRRLHVIFNNHCQLFQLP